MGVASWLLLQAPESAASAAVSEAALAVLEDKMKWTAGLLDGYLEAYALETDGWCETAQRTLAALPSPKEDAKLLLDFYYRDTSTDFEHFHTNYTNTTTPTGEIATLEVAIGGHAAYPSNWFNTGMLSSADEVGCKLISADRIAEQMEVTPVSFDVSCKDVNMAAVETARGLASASTLARYDAIGKPITFEDDWQVSIGPQFIFISSLKMTENDDALVVQSPKDYTALDSAFYPGQHYCKLLSPARVLDWMMTTGLPNRYE